MANPNLCPDHPRAPGNPTDSWTTPRMSARAVGTTHVTLNSIVAQSPVYVKNVRSACGSRTVRVGDKHTLTEKVLRE